MDKFITIEETWVAPSAEYPTGILMRKIGDKIEITEPIVFPFVFIRWHDLDTKIWH